jgi:hypothetical protein
MWRVRQTTADTAQVRKNSRSGIRDGAIVTDAKHEARFLTAYTNGTLLKPYFLSILWRGNPSGCSGPSSTSAAAQATASNQTSSTLPTAAASPCSSSTA